jgi:hypothetical protein
MEGKNMTKYLALREWAHKVLGYLVAIEIVHEQGQDVPVEMESQLHEAAETLARLVLEEGK